MSARPRSAKREPTDDDYRRLLEFRTGLRRFVRWSEHAAKASGLSPAIHQLLLAIRGSGVAPGPTVGDLAEFLVVRHHTAVEAIDRAQQLGLVERIGDSEDQRVVRVRLTREGEERLRSLTEQHLAELGRLAPSFSDLWDGLAPRG